MPPCLVSNVSKIKEGDDSETGANGYVIGIGIEHSVLDGYAVITGGDEAEADNAAG